MKRIVVIEDDVQVREELICLLDKNGYEGIGMEQFDDVPQQIAGAQADLVLLDISLPGADGINLLREIRRDSDVPIIMVTSKDTEMDELMCMSFGADDFIAKPYHPSILLLHIEAVFKRMRKGGEILEYGIIRLDSARGQLLIGGKTVELSKNEFRILTYLLKNQGKIVAREELMGYLWDSEEFVDDNTLTVNVNRVRKKMEEHGVCDVIKTKRGQGYLVG